MGVMTERIGLDSALQRVGFNFLTVHLGSYLLLAHQQDIVSVGIDGSLQAGLQFANREVSYLLQVPLFLTGRWGCGATTFNEQKFGFGLGVGLNSSYLSIRGLSGLDQNSLGVTTFIINPSILGEARIKTKKRAVIMRLHLSLTGPERQGVLPVSTFDDTLLFERARTRFLSMGWGVLLSF
jgi:hypothetical protein